MKFVCDRCSTRYSISDEKVAGKVLKIRCKTCGNIIVVREQGVTSQAAEQASQSAAAAAGGGGSRGPAPRTELDLGTTAPAAQSGTGVEWFVAIKGKQHGPMTQAEVSNLYRQGKITARSYCWNEGLSGWVRLRELPDFQPLIASGPGPAPAPKAPPPPPDEAGAEVVDLQQRRKEREAATGDHPNPAADPFAAVTSGVPSAAANQAPRESTRVFIMNAGLANRSRKHRIYAAVATVAILLFSGLLAADFYGYIEIPLLHNVVTYAAETAGFEEPEKRKTKRIVSDLSEDELMALKCQLNPSKPECVKLRERLAKKNRRRSGRRNSGTGLDLGNGDFNMDGAFQTGGGDTNDIARTRLTAADIDKIKGSDPELAKKLAAMLQGDGPRRSTRDRVAPELRTGPESKAPPIPAATIKQVFGNNVSAVQACVTQALKRGEKIPGKEKLNVRILPKGVVGRAKLNNATTNASPLGQCITKAAKRMKFPPFAGEAFDVVSPLILGGG